MKKLLFLIMALICVAEAYAADGDTFTYNGLNYKVISEENHEVAVSQNEDISGAIEIPYYVVNGSSRYFVTEIGSSAFNGCSGLTSVAIPNSVTKIGYGAFAFCKGLTSVTIPTSVTKIDSGAFIHCHGLNSVTIPKSVTEIGSNAFCDCIGLTSITIPNSVTEIGYGSFSDCDNLVEVIVEDGNSNFVAIDGMLIKIDKSELIQCPGAKTSVTIPNSVTVIGSRAFSGCHNLTSVTIPSSVTRIGYFAFVNCISLSSLTIPNSVIEIDGDAFKDCHGLTSVTIPNSVTKIGDGAFSSCSGLTSVTIPNTVSVIRRLTFADCSSLESVVIPASVKEIEYAAFRGCSKLTKIYNLNLTPQTLGEKVFNGVPQDAVVYIPKGSFKQYFVANGWTYFIDFREMGAFDITMSNEAVELAVSETVTLKAEVNKDDDMTVQSSEWTSYNPAVATVDQAGIVTAVAPGEAVIYFTATDGYGVPHAVSCKVTVTENSVIESITVDADAPVEVYTIGGIRVADTTDNLPVGIYIVRKGNVTKKIAVK